MGDVIRRDPAAAARETHDLIVVGGGIHGVALALEATRRGLRPLLLERDDFGSRTSWNSLRIIHGGLRYLQTLDMKRFFESVHERRWFLRHYPDLVRPLACLMPLYDRGLRRRGLFRLALAANAVLSSHRNEGVRDDRVLARGGLLSREQTLSRFPAARRERLRGGALWFDAVMPDSQRLLIELLHWAARDGATALNYVEVLGLVTAAGRVAGVEARERETGDRLAFRAPIVVNCAGPWNRTVARSLDRDVEQLLYPMLAFNVLLAVEPPFDCAVAVTPDRSGAQTFFMYPWKGGVLAGTCQTPWGGGPDCPPPSEEQVKSFLDDLQSSVQDFAVGPRDVARVYWGLLPTARLRSDRLAVREVVHDHARHGGPEGLYSVTGIKFTTARRVAERTLRAIGARRAQPLPPRRPSRPPEPVQVPPLADFRIRLDVDPEGTRELVERLIANEAVRRLEDLVLRRTDWGLAPDAGRAVAPRICRVLGWDAATTARETSFLG